MIQTWEDSATWPLMGFMYPGYEEYETFCTNENKCVG